MVQLAQFLSDLFSAKTFPRSLRFQHWVEPNLMLTIPRRCGNGNEIPGSCKPDERWKFAIERIELRFDCAQGTIAFSKRRIIV